LPAHFDSSQAPLGRFTWEIQDEWEDFRMLKTFQVRRMELRLDLGKVELKRRKYYPTRSITPA
jgi:hypothetical protein